MKQFALLVGIDLYQSNGFKKREGNDVVSLTRLHKCINDVQTVKEFSQSKSQLDDTCELTSSSLATNSDISKEPQDRYHTFDNIKKYSDKVKEDARLHPRTKDDDGS